MSVSIFQVKAAVEGAWNFLGAVGISWAGAVMGAGRRAAHLRLHMDEYRCVTILRCQEGPAEPSQPLFLH